MVFPRFEAWVDLTPGKRESHSSQNQGHWRLLESQARKGNECVGNLKLILVYICQCLTSYDELLQSYKFKNMILQKLNMYMCVHIYMDTCPSHVARRELCFLLECCVIHLCLLLVVSLPLVSGLTLSMQHGLDSRPLADKSLHFSFLWGTRMICTVWNDGMRTHQERVLISSQVTLSFALLSPWVGVTGNSFGYESTCCMLRAVGMEHRRTEHYEVHCSCSHISSGPEKGPQSKLPMHIHIWIAVLLTIFGAKGSGDNSDNMFETS